MRIGGTSVSAFVCHSSAVLSMHLMSDFRFQVETW